MTNHLELGMHGVRPRPGRSRSAVLRVRRISQFVCAVEWQLFSWFCFESEFNVGEFSCADVQTCLRPARVVSGHWQGGSGRGDLIVDFVLYGAGRRIERGENSYSARLVDP